MAKRGKNPSTFFRVIFPHILQKYSLELPRNFTKEYGKGFKYVFLELPTGAESKMEIKRRKNRAWLHKGWSDFVEKYSIQGGDFLVFEYKGKSRFSVKIYDWSTWGIQYPVINAKTPDKVIEVKEELVSDDDHENVANLSRNGVLQKANAFRTSSLGFKVAMTPAYVGRSAYLHVPAGPARSYILKKGKNKSIQFNLNGRTWSIKYRIGSPSRNGVRFKCGWHIFSRENHLQQGDICAFELVNGGDPIVFKVTIKRKNKSLPCHSSGTKETRDQTKIRKRKCNDSPKESRPRKRTKDVQPNESSFSVVMRKSSVHKLWSKLPIPAYHSSRYLMDQHGNEAFLHGHGDKIWPVNIYVGGSLGTKFSSGWKNFVVDNNLQQGDTCVFKLLSQLPNHYKVTIRRVAA